MIPLLMKEFRIRRKVFYILPSIFFLIVPVQSGGESIWLAVSMNVFIVSLVAEYSHFDEWKGGRIENKLLLSMPVTRAKTVIIRYAMGAVWCSIVFIPYFLKAIIDTQFTVSPLYLFRTLVLSFCIIYLIISACYPLYYLIGWKTAQLINGLLSMIPMWFGIFSGYEKMTEIDHAVTLSMTGSVMVLMLSGTFVVVTLSVILSNRLFRGKDVY